MKENQKRWFRGSVEAAILVVLLSLFAGVLVVAWGGAVKLRQTIASSFDMMNVDTSALVELEELRNLNKMRIANRRAYFLLGSKATFDEQEEQKELFDERLATLEGAQSHPDARETIQQIKNLEQQEEAFFEQGIEFRDKETEAKIVAQFYNSKTSPLIPQVDEKFERLKNLHKAGLEGSRERVRNAGLEAQALVIDGMAWLTGAVAVLFSGMALLAVFMMYVRRRYLRERDRLVQEAKQAILARDEVIAAVSRDMLEPLSELRAISPADGIERVQSIAIEMQSLLEDIYDQKKADMGALNLRLEQLPVADVLSAAQDMMLPAAKQRSITVRFDSISPSVLAYADRERVLRVLSNLLGNAIKFSPRNSRVSVKVKADAQFVNISVHDAGPGIPEQQLEGIFDNFWQSRKAAEQGAGVGLAVVKTIMDAHGGMVRAENSGTGGSVFTIALQRRRPIGVQLKKSPAPEVSVIRTKPADSNSPRMDL